MARRILGGLNVQAHWGSLLIARRRWVPRGSGLLVALPDRHAGRPVIYLPPGVRAPRPAAAQSQELRRKIQRRTVHWTVTVADSEALTHGRYVVVDQESTEGAWRPPEAERASMQIGAFLSKVVAVPAIDSQLRVLAGRYAEVVELDPANWFSHLLSFDRWEYRLTHKVDYPVVKVERMCPHSDGWRYYELPDDYGRALMRLAEQLRLGPSWPRLLHALVVTFRLLKCHPNPDDGEPSFEPLITCNLIDTERDAWYSYWNFNRVTLETPDGRSIVISPDEQYHDVRKRIVNDPDLRRELERQWPHIRKLMAQIVKYQRRRTDRNQPLERVDWLFRHHVLGERMEDIAQEMEKGEETVRDVVKDLRRSLGLRSRGAIKATARRRRLPRLIEA